MNSTDEQTHLVFDIGKIISLSESIIHGTEIKYKIPPGYLLRQLALHIPQFHVNEIFCTSNSELLNEDLITRECERLAQVIQMKIKALPEEMRLMVQDQGAKHLLKIEGQTMRMVSRENTSGSLSEVIFKPVQRAIGKAIQENLHYMGADRHDSLYEFGLYDMRHYTEYPFAYVAFSSLDRQYVLNSLPFHSDPKNLYSLCRAYSVNSAPHNSTSVLIAQSMKYIQERHSETNAIMTSVNPNILFLGSAFKASGFIDCAEYPFAPKYIDGVYYTRRRLQEKLNEDPHAKVSGSQNVLKPIRLLFRPVSKGLIQHLNSFSPKQISMEKYDAG